jgi:TPR repeat protein
MYLHGKGAERDVGKASELLKLAAQNGSTLAYTDLFDVLWESDDESAEEEKVQIVEYLASVGEPEAQRLRGRMLRHASVWRRTWRRRSNASESPSTLMLPGRCRTCAIS